MDGNEELSARQLRVIPYLLGAPSVEEGCKRARVSRAAVYEWLMEDTFRHELKRRRDAVIERAVDSLKANISKATETLVKWIEGLKMNLERRLALLERKLRPGELCAVIDGFVDDSGAPGALAFDDPRLQQGVDEEGEAIISRWWSVWFFKGTREQQDARLKELRLDPRFQTPCNENEFPVVFEGGATCEDAYLRLQEEERNEKLKPATTS